MLIKLVRLLANISINSQVGNQVFSCSDCHDADIVCALCAQAAQMDGVQALVALLRQSLKFNREELVRSCRHAFIMLYGLLIGLCRTNDSQLLNVVSSITNLSYYIPRSDQGRAEESKKSNSESGEFLSTCSEEICAALCETVFHRNEEIVAEACRAFGNISRDAQVWWLLPMNFAYLKRGCWQVRLCMKNIRADEALVLLLDHSNREVRGEL